MVTTIERRVKRLEKPAGGVGGDGCGYCGDGDDDRRDEPYIVTFDDEMPPDFPETCPECGRELITTIYFDDDPRAPWSRHPDA